MGYHDEQPGPGDMPDALAEMRQAASVITNAISTLMIAAGAAIGQRDAEIARLQGELDRAGNRMVIMVTQPEKIADAMIENCAEPEGTILRSTQEGRDWVMLGRIWQEVRQDEQARG